MEIKSTNNLGTWETADLGIASSAVALGGKLAGINRDNPRKVLFLLVNAPNPDELIGKYWSNRLQVDAHTMVESIKAVKGMLYAG